MTALAEFSVFDTLYEVVETNTTDVGNNLPTVVPISGTVTFTPSINEVDGGPLDSTIMLDPIQGRFSADINATTYTTLSGDTWATVVAQSGALGITQAVLETANPTLTSPFTAGLTVVIPAAIDGALRSLNGSLGVGLVDNVDLGLPEGALTYRVDYSNVNFDGVGERIIASLRFAAPGNGAAVDLNTVTRLPL